MAKDGGADDSGSDSGSAGDSLDTGDSDDRDSRGGDDGFDDHGGDREDARDDSGFDDDDDDRGHGGRGRDDDRGEFADDRDAADEDGGFARDDGGREFEADVILAADLDAAALQQVEALGYRAAGRSELDALGLTVTRLEIPGGLDLDAAHAELTRAQPGILLDFNLRYALAQSATACSGVRCFGRALIRWLSPRCSGGEPVIGMLDAAVARDTPALRGRALTVRRFAPTAASPAELEHGTAVAAQLVGDPASDFPGLMPDARVFAADVFERDARGESATTTERLVAGLDWLAQQKPLVINASLAGPDSPLLAEAVRRLAARGIPVVAAAGNDGPRATPRYPAALEGVIAVTAVDRFLKIYPRANQGTYIDVAAPGVGIWTAAPDGSGRFRDGTSFAAPFVTAQVAALRQARPDLNGPALREALHDDALDLGAPGRDEVYGAGLARIPACGGP